jgi:capsular polysaccharide biosynthesis protein
LEVSAETVILSPAIELDVPGAINLPDEIDRILGFSNSFDKRAFQQWMSGGPVFRPATIARRFAKAWIADGVVYAESSYLRIAHGARPLIARGECLELKRRMLATDYVTEKYFGHWLLDGQSYELLAAESQQKALGLEREPWLQEPGYRVLTGLELERTRLAYVEELWLVDDRSINASRLARMAELRRRVRSSQPSDGNRAPVFLRRVGGATRRLVNQDALADALARRGVTVLTPETESVPRLVSVLRDAPMVISVEGSALCHGILGMADGGTIVAIQPPTRADGILKVWADAAGLRLAYTVASPYEDGFVLNEERLMRLLDLVAGSA